MPIVVSATYASADSVTQRFWPLHNRTQGIAWDARSVGLIAREGEASVGAATIKIVGGVATLEQLVVDPDAVGRGVGGLLMREVEVVARSADCHLIDLETAETQARPFYEKHGYAVFAERPNSKFGMTWYMMEKRLG